MYHIACSHCHLIYIGETGRMIGSHIKEHLRMKKQTVYMHIKTHCQPTNRIQCPSKQKTIEALEIRKYPNCIVNGCIGRKN